MERFKYIAKYVGIYLLFVYVCFCFYEFELANPIISLGKIQGPGRIVFFVFGLLSAIFGNETYIEKRK